MTLPMPAAALDDSKGSTTTTPPRTLLEAKDYDPSSVIHQEAVVTPTVTPTAEEEEDLAREQVN